MTIATETEIELIPDESHIVLDDVSWETYESLLRDFEASGCRKRVVYNEGRMVIVSPLPKHERWKSLIGGFVEVIADECDIPICTFGSTTWRRKRKKRGLEPDECFYIQKEKLVRGRVDLDLKRDPPPDLAIEVDLRPYLIHKLSVYAGLKIPEVWCFDGIKFDMFALQEDGSYESVPASVAFPFLKPGDLVRFLDQFTQTDQNSLMRAVRKWAAQAREVIQYGMSSSLGGRSRSSRFDQSSSLGRSSG